MSGQTGGYCTRWMIVNCTLSSRPMNKNTCEGCTGCSFEAYLPSRPELKHRYNSPRHATLGGLDFYVDTWLWKEGDKVTPGSDEEHLLALLRSKGYGMPHSMMEVRLVHLMDMKRKELMVIYGEDLAATGYTAEQLQPDGQAHDRWPAVEGQLLQRAEQKIHIGNAAQP